jgi:hypothetical protein
MQGHELAAQTLANANEIHRLSVESLEAALRNERKAHADYALQKSYDNVRATKDAQGKVDADVALTYIQKAQAAHDQAVADMEEIIAKYQKAEQAFLHEIQLTAKLMGELKAYDAAGVDPAQVAAEAAQIVPVLKASEVK